jgi:hypothetical protein
VVTPLRERCSFGSDCALSSLGFALVSAPLFLPLGFLAWACVGEVTWVWSAGLFGGILGAFLGVGQAFDRRLRQKKGTRAAVDLPS